MSDKLIIGKVVFSENDSKTTEACKVYIPPPGQRKVRVVKRDQRTLDEKLVAFRRSAIGLMEVLRALYPKEYDSFAEKSFDTANDSP